MTVSLKIHIEPLPEGMWADGRRVDAFEEMYRRCYPQLVDLCRRILCGRGDPEAVAQEAFVRAWRSLDSFSGARPFWPWVATIARRLCIDHRRRLDRESTNLHVAAAVNERSPELPDELLETDEDHRSVLLALRNLKPAEQRVITLRDLNGWSYDQIARFEGVTVESIRGSLKRARASLRRSYAKLGTGAPAVLGWRRLRGLRALADRLGPVLSSGWGAELVAGAVAAALALATAAPPVQPAGAVAAVAVSFDTPLPSPSWPSSSTGLASGATGSPQPAAPTSTDIPAGGGEVPSSPGASLPFLPGDGAATPEQATFTQIVASPDYEHDRILFATGAATTGCPYVTCPVLFRSDDAGRSWRRLAGRDLAAGTVLLPPAFPADNRIFVAGAAALLVSSDNGSSFRVAAPIGGQSAISPTFAEDHRIVIGQAPGWEYRADLQVMHPSGLVLPSTSASTVPAFSPRYVEDKTLFVGATMVSEAGQQRSTVFRCVGSVCTEAAGLGALVGSPTLSVSPTLERDGLVFAWRGTALFRSSDGGRSFARLALPTAGYVQAVSFAPDGQVLVGVRRVTDSGTAGGLLSSTDGGRSWRALGPQTALQRGVDAVVGTADGRIIAGLASSGGGGLLCSNNGGISWATRCAD